MAVDENVDALTLYIIDVNKLIRNIESRYRAKDLADSEYLEKIMELRKKNLN